MSWTRRDIKAPGLSEEAALLAGCATGNKASLRALYDREAPSMIGVAQRILRRRELAEDAVHDAFVQIWRKASSFDPEIASARTWIYAILRHRALNMVRDGRREDLVDDEVLAGLGDSDAYEAHLIGRMTEASALRRCLEHLEPIRRSSLLLAYVDGFTHAEIADRLGVPLGTVKAWIRRSLLALRECLA
jgi:RNA polymerase sigma factor (sigma-70 family)